MLFCSGKGRLNGWRAAAGVERARMAKQLFATAQAPEKIDGGALRVGEVERGQGGERDEQPAPPREQGGAC